MKKKFLVSLIIIISLFVLIGCTYKKEETKTLKTLKYFRDITLNDIQKIEIIRYTEAGDNHKEETDINEITTTYNMISNIKVGKETDMVCEDNTTVYVFYLNSDKKISIEIECDWIILDGKRYLIK